MPRKDIKINIADDNESSDDEVQRVVKPKKEPKVKEVIAEPEPVVQPVAVPVAEPVAVVKEKKKRNFTEAGKEQILKNLEMAKLKKQVQDLSKRLANEGKTPTQVKKDEKKKQTQEQLEEAIKKVMVKPEKKKKIIFEDDSDSEEEVIIRRKAKAKPKKKIIYEDEPDSPPPAPKANSQGNLEELQRVLYGNRAKSYFL